MQVFLGVFALNEVFICAYDLPALLLIISGSICIILTANFSDTASSVAIHKENLTSIKTLAYMVCVFLLLNLTFVFVKW